MDLEEGVISPGGESNLPFAQGPVRIYGVRSEILHLVAGRNDMEQIQWRKGSSVSEFFDSLRSCSRWGKNPEDRTYLIEAGPVIKPSPVISFLPSP